MARRDPDKTDRMGLVIGCILIAAPPLGITAVLFQIHEGRQSMRWPATQATIARSSVSKHVSKSSKSRRKQTSYHVDVVYRYTVDGHSYSTSRWRVGKQNWFSSRSKSRAKRWAAAHAAVGKTVRIYYDPQEPSAAVVERGSSKGLYVVLVLLPIFGGVGVFFAHHSAPKSRRRNKKRMLVFAGALTCLLWAAGGVAVMLV